MSMVSSTVVRSGAGGRRRPLVLGRSRSLPSWLGLLVATTWVLASPAWAAEPPSNVRYTRPAPQVRPVADPKAAIETARQAAADAPSGPSSAGSPFTRPSKAIELAAIDDQLQLLEALLQEAGPDDKEYPDYLFRYADLHLDRKAIFEDQVGALYEEIHTLREAGKPDAARRLLAKQRTLQQKARAASEAAVKAYALLVTSQRWSG
jgi:hypothetical protein